MNKKILGALEKVLVLSENKCELFLQRRHLEGHLGVGIIPQILRKKLSWDEDEVENTFWHLHSVIFGSKN